MRIELIADDKLERVCQGFSLLDDKDKMFIMGIVEGLVFAKEKVEKPEAAIAQKKVLEKT